MTLNFTVGGAKATFEARIADEVADVLDNAFGAEGDWEGVPPRHFGTSGREGWAELQRRAVEALGSEGVPNLLALGNDPRGVYLPTHVRAVSLPMACGETLRCASLPGLRRELSDLAEHWELPLHDDALRAILTEDEDGGVADAPEIAVFARLALAANEAVRRDCPLWLVGED